MSKRYGRNQRRKARARIAELELENNRLGARVRRAHNESTALRETLSVARRVLGPCHPAFPPTKIEGFNGEIEGFNGESVRVARYRTLDTWPFDTRVLTAGDIEAQWLRAEVMTVKAQKEKFWEAVHFRIKYDDLQWGYAVSAAAFSSTPPEVMAKRIAVELAPLIVSAITDKAR